MTAAALDDWYARLFGVDDEDLWHDLTVRTHTLLSGYPGCYVAWRGDGVHVSVPSTWPAGDAGMLATQEIADLQDAGFWASYAAGRGLRLLGPAVHAYLDRPPRMPTAPGRGVVRLGTGEPERLRAEVRREEWDEAGLDEGQLAFGLYDDDALVAAADLRDVDALPRDVTVVVAASARGQGLATRVGGHAAAYAVEQHGWARWRWRSGNAASSAVATRLGFEPWCTQLAVCP